MLSLNPYSNGSTTMGNKELQRKLLIPIRLNPYSNGSTTMGADDFSELKNYLLVLILILMEVPQWE